MSRQKEKKKDVKGEQGTLGPGKNDTRLKGVLNWE